MKLKFLSAALLMLVLSFSSCTENARAKKYGGSFTINVEAGQKVTNITWKNDELWYSTRPFAEGEVPVVQTFVEESSWGLLEGKVTFIESK